MASFVNRLLRCSPETKKAGCDFCASLWLKMIARTDLTRHARTIEILGLKPFERKICHDENDVTCGHHSGGHRIDPRLGRFSDGTNHVLCSTDGQGHIPG